MKNITFQKFLQIMTKRLRWWLIIHRKGIKEAVETIALAAAMIGLPVLMFLDWLIYGYGMTVREKALMMALMVIAGKKLWKEDE